MDSASKRFSFNTFVETIYFRKARKRFIEGRRCSTELTYIDLSLDSTHLPSWVWEVYCYHFISIVSKTLAFKIFVKFRSDLKLYRQWNRKKFEVENNLSVTRGGTMTFDCWGLIHHPLEASSSFNLSCRHPRLLWSFRVSFTGLIKVFESGSEFVCQFSFRNSKMCTAALLGSGLRFCEASRCEKSIGNCDSSTRKSCSKTKISEPWIMLEHLSPTWCQLINPQRDRNSKLLQFASDLLFL